MSASEEVTNPYLCTNTATAPAAIEPRIEFSSMDDNLLIPTSLAMTFGEPRKEIKGLKMLKEYSDKMKSSEIKTVKHDLKQELLDDCNYVDVKAEQYIVGVLASIPQSTDADRRAMAALCLLNGHNGQHFKDHNTNNPQKNKPDFTLSKAARKKANKAKTGQHQWHEIITTAWTKEQLNDKLEAVEEFLHEYPKYHECVDWWIEETATGAPHLHHRKGKNPRNLAVIVVSDQLKLSLEKMMVKHCRFQNQVDVVNQKTAQHEKKDKGPALVPTSQKSIDKFVKELNKDIPEQQIHNMIAYHKLHDHGAGKNGGKAIRNVDEND